MYAIRSYYAPVDLVFQSIAGTEAANRGFGSSLALLEEARQAALSLGRGSVGENVMYFDVITSYSIHYTKLYDFLISFGSRQRAAEEFGKISISISLRAFCQ